MKEALFNSRPCCVDVGFTRKIRQRLTVLSDIDTPDIQRLLLTGRPSGNLVVYGFGAPLDICAFMLACE